METKPLVVIVGPTASGKTALAIKLAKQFGGEIICADSRTVYRHMDIGTAKPTIVEQAEVQHWGIDLVEPDERYTASDFKKYALQKIEEIRKRGHIPFLVGGSGLYIDAVIFDYQFGDSADPTLRQKLDKMTLENLTNYCIENNIELPENSNNKRYIIRSIEQNGINNKRKNVPILNSFIVGITTDKEKLHTKITARASQLLNNGVIEEAKKLGDKYGWESEAMTGNIYPLCLMLLKDEITQETLLEQFITLDKRLAKRQMTWFRRNEFIKWFSIDQAEQYIASLLA